MRNIIFTPVIFTGFNLQTLRYSVANYKYGTIIMNKLSIRACFSEGLSYVVKNFSSLSLLIVQVFVILSIGNVLFPYLIVQNIYGIENEMNIFIGFSLTLGTLLSIAASAFLVLPIYRNIILKEPFEANLLKIVIEKRYWYGLWATLKMYISALGLTLGVLSPVVIVLLILLLPLIVAIFTSGPESTVFLGFLYSSLFSQTGIFVSLGLLFIVALVIFIYALANYIYAPLLAFIDKIASVRDSWRLCTGNRLRISGLLFCLYFIVGAGVLLFYFPAIYSINESEHYSSVFLMLCSYLNLYFGAFFAAVIGVSYLLIRKKKT